MSHSKRARTRGQVRQRRRHRAERRAATAPIRQAYNAQQRAAGHPGWQPNLPWWLRDWIDTDL